MNESTAEMDGRDDAVMGRPQAGVECVRAPEEARDVAIILVTSFGHFLCHFAEVMFPAVLLALLHELSMEPDEATLLALSSYLLFGLGVLSVGVCAGRWGTAWLFGVVVVRMAGRALPVPLAPTTMALFAALTALGLAASIYHPVGLSMISLGVARRSRAMRINGVAGNVGIASSPLVAWLAIEFL